MENNMIPDAGVLSPASAKAETIPLISPSGTVEEFPANADITGLLGLEYKLPTKEQFQSIQNEKMFGDPLHQFITAGEGFANVPTFGQFTALETALGRDPYAIRAGREVNPLAHGIGQAAGLLTPVGASALMPKAGAGAARLLGLGGEGAGFASRVAGSAVRGATEMALFQAGDEFSKMYSHDPGQTLGSALANVGTGALFGGAVGGALGTVSPLWEAASGSKLGQFIEDFRGRLGQHINNPDPLLSLEEEIGNVYNSARSVSDEVYGSTGLKAQENAKLMPEMTEKIGEQVDKLKTAVNNTLEKLGDDPLASKLRKSFANWENSITEASPFESVGGKQFGLKNDPLHIFQETELFKKQLQEWGKYNKFLVPVAEREFRDASKGLSAELRTALEDSNVWGKAGERQQAVNKAFTEYLPSLKDFEKKFTSELNGERVIDPGKIQTYLNQLDKPGGELKREALKKFIEASEKYKDVIAKTHANLGIESPMEAVNTTRINQSFNKSTPGQRAADAFVNKGMGKVLGAGVGGALGHHLGMGGFGALIGEHALEPFFNSILPALAGPLLEKNVSGAGAKAAIDYGLAAQKGANLIKKSVKGVFQAGVSMKLAEKMPTEKDREKLDKQITMLQNDPTQVMNMGQNLQHYLPEHAEQIGYVMGSTLNYLLSLKPNTQPQGMLDRPPVVNPVAKSIYDRALNIAISPLIVVDSVKQGTVTQNDVTALKTMMPDLYSKISEEMMTHMVDHQHKGMVLPYSTKLGISTFLGVPVDSSMRPQSIVSSQAAIGAHQATHNAGKPMETVKNANSLSKLGREFATPQQMRVINRGK